MSIDRAVTSVWAQRISLLLLRVSTGFLLVWFGLNKVVKGSGPRVFVPLSRKTRRWRLSSA